MAAGLAASCAESNVVLTGIGDVVSMSVSPDSANVAIGGTVQLRSHPLSATGALLAGLPTTWVSSNTAVATVDDAGLVTGIANGTTEIVVTVGSFEDRASITVAPGPSIALSDNTIFFVTTAGGADPAPDTVSVTNGGGFTLVGLAVESISYGGGAADWLTASFSGSTAPADLILTPQTGAVTTAGTYTATVTISGVDASWESISVTLDVTEGPADSITIRDGDGQTAPAGSAVPVAPSVLVTDAFGNPASGEAVTFSVSGGGGSVTGGAAITDAAGIATVGSWTLGNAAGANTLDASTPGVAPVQFTATGTPGAATQIQVSAGDGQSAVAGASVAIAPAAAALDAFGNGVPGVDITFTVTGGGGSVTGASQTTDATGVAMVGSWTLGSTAGANTLLATSASVADSATFTATGLSGAADNMSLDGGDAQTDTVAATLATDFSVRIVDNLGNGVSGIPVAWAVTGGGGTITTTSNTDANGVAVATRVHGMTAGVHTATASVGGLTGSPVTFTSTATPGAPAAIVTAAGDGQSATVATAVATAPQARVEDQFGNAIAGHSVTFAVTGGGGTVDPTTAVTTDANGLATVTSWTLGTTSGTSNNTLGATAAGGGLTGNPLTFTASASPDAPASIAISMGDGQSSIAGVNVATPPQALVEDQFGNPVAGVTVDFTPSADGQVGTPSATTNGSGIAMTTWAPGTVGATMASDGTFANTLDATVQGTALTVQFSGTASYSYATHIDPIWSRAGPNNCTGCHGGLSGLTLSGGPAASYASLVNVMPVCDGGLGTDYRRVNSSGGVQAADDFSILIRLIDTSLPFIGGCNTEMPGAGGLPAGTVDTVRAWVRNGAPNN